MKRRRIISLLFALMLGATSVLGNGMMSGAFDNHLNKPKTEEVSENAASEENNKNADSEDSKNADSEDVSENTASENSVYVEEAFQINSVEDFLEFSDSCRKNSWSKNRIVYLNQDLDLKDVEFNAIPSFSGYFKGNGHTISNLYINEGDEAVGLFRYLETDGNICDLTVEGYIVSSDSRDLVGGIVGVNSGTILNCTFTGKMRAVNVAGGIAGLNGGTGKIVNCENQGFIISQSNVGGITGINRGLLSDCVNNGDVNSDSSWVDDPVDPEVDINNINTVSDALNTGKNIGGISGWSNGIIATCINNGTVGYLKTGENVGGVVGCHSGSIFYCKNNGKVYGKQDVGGIAGQFEPTIVIKDIQEIKDEVDKLHDVLNDSTDDMDKATDKLTDDLDELNKKSDTITNIGNKVSDEGLDNIEKNIDVANDFSTRTDYVTNHMSPINKNISTALNDMDEINKILDKMEADSNMSQSDKDKIKASREKIDKRSKEMRTSLEAAQSDLKEAERLMDNGESASGNKIDKDAISNNKINKDDISISKEAQEKLVDAMINMADAAIAAADISGYVNDIYNVAGPYMDDTSSALSKDADRLTETTDDMLEALTSANDQTGAILDYLNSLDKLEIINFSSDFDKNIENLQNEVDSTLDSMDRLNKDAAKHSDVLEEDIRNINDQMQVVTDLVIDRISNFEAAANGDNIIVDVSENDKTGEMSASITGCNNKGNVDGTSNIGGIIGSIGLDSSEENSKGLGSKYEVSAVVLSNTNSGFVTVKNKNAGGIAGNVVAGYIAECISSGGVISEEGNYLGGIAGNCQGSIESCKSLAVLSGGEYIGGIAGVADDVYNCYSMPMIRDSVGRTGAVIGAYQSDDDDITVYHQGMSDHIYNNYFVSDILFGIDSVSYTGVAEPVEYEELLQLVHGFDSCKIYFVDEDYNIIKEMQYRYGYDLTNLKYPDVYTDTKTYAEWDKPASDVLTSNLVLRSVVVDNVTIIASQEMSMGKALAFAEGIFTKEAVLTVNRVYDNGAGVLASGESTDNEAGKLANGEGIEKGAGKIAGVSGASVSSEASGVSDASVSGETADASGANVSGETSDASGASASGAATVLGSASLPEGITLPEVPANASVVVYEVELENADVAADQVVNIRILQEYEGKSTFYIITGQNLNGSGENAGANNSGSVADAGANYTASFVKADAKNIGSYWQLEMVGDKAYVCVVTIPDNKMLVYYIAGGVALLLIVGCVCVIKKKKKKM